MAISLQDAHHHILDKVSPLPRQILPTVDAVGRAVIEDLHADHPLPSFDNSAMDGFAFAYADSANQSTLPVNGFIPAGHAVETRLTPGSMCKIMTGAPVPKGADTVIPVENCAYDEATVTIIKPVPQGANIRRTGEDVRPGQKVVSAGTRLTPGMINLLAALQITGVPVARQPRVAILATGDELQEAGEPLLPGGIVNSNSQGLAAALKEIHAVPIMLGIAQDNVTSLRKKIAEGLTADVLITSAGVSAGDRDLVRDVLLENGYNETFWKVNIRPGKPSAFGLCNQVPVFALPGNPVATMLLFEILVRPALLKMMGHTEIFKPTFRARLTAPLKKKPGLMQAVRLTVSRDEKGDLCTASAGDQNTGTLSTLAAADGYTILPEEKDYFAAGEVIDIRLF